MYRYKIYGIIFDSDIELDECEKVSPDTTSEVTIRYGELSDMVSDMEKIKSLGIRTNEKGEEASRYVKKDGNIYYNCVVDVGYYKVTEGKLIEYRPCSSVEDHLFRQWLLCYAVTVAMIQQRKVIVHCAGLLVPNTDNAIIVCGDSGAGKSTISDALMKKGLQFVSDDSVRLEYMDNEAKVIGSYRQRRFCTDVVEREGYNLSEFIRLEEGSRIKWMKIVEDGYMGDRPHRFHKMFFLTLTEKDKLEIKKVTGHEKIINLMRALYKTDVYKSEGLSPDLFQKMTNITKDTDVYVISRPKQGLTIEEITDFIYKESLKTEN